MFERPYHQSVAQVLHALDGPLLRENAYGKSILQDLEKAIDQVQSRDGWLERCMLAMAMELPKALVWKKIRALRQILPRT